MKFETLIKLFFNILYPSDKKLLETINFDKFEKSNEINNNFKAIFKYSDKRVRNIVKEIKRTGNRSLVDKMAEYFYDFLIEEISDKILFDNFQKPIIIPIPKHKLDLLKGGIDQCKAFVKKLENIDNGSNFEFSYNSLRKIKRTEKQALTKKHFRESNLKDCFKIFGTEIVGKNIILIDDVITTGSTMKEAKKTLLEAGAKKVLGFSIAH